MSMGITDLSHDSGTRYVLKVNGLRYAALMGSDNDFRPSHRGKLVLGHRTDTDTWYITAAQRTQEVDFGQPLGPFTEAACRTFLMLLPQVKP